MKEHAISIWYLIGQLLVIYGALIGGTGIYYCFHPQPERLILAYLHADLWWGVFMFLLGLFYISKFNPSKTKQ